MQPADPFSEQANEAVAEFLDRGHLIVKPLHSTPLPRASLRCDLNTYDLVTRMGPPTNKKVVDSIMRYGHTLEALQFLVVNPLPWARLLATVQHG